jgi:IS30 family transposase
VDSRGHRIIELNGLGIGGGAWVERPSAKERERFAGLLVGGAPFWRLWEEVQRSRHAIRRAVLALSRPAPRERTRSRLRWLVAEGEEISRGRVAGLWLRQIVRGLGRSASTVSREVTRNGGRRASRGCRADRGALRRACRPRTAKLVSCPRLRKVVAAKLELGWSREQISGWLVREFPDDVERRVSHETIYQSLFVQSRGALGKELSRSLRTQRSRRRPAAYPKHVRHGQGRIRNLVPSSERPAEADDRAVPGHWEGDLIYGQGIGTVATLVERSSRVVMLVGLPTSHTAEVVADALAAKIGELPAQLRRSLTWDQGQEMAAHSPFTVASGVPVFFCDPRSSWSAAPTRTPTASCANTSRARPGSQTAPTTSSMRSPPNSMDDPARHSTTGHQPKHSRPCCLDRLRPPPLRRSYTVPVSAGASSRAEPRFWRG